MLLYGSLRRTFQFLVPISIKRSYTEFEYPSSASLNNRPTIYNQSQGPNTTGNISLALYSKRRLVVLALRILLSNKKSLELPHMAKIEIRIRNWHSLTGLLIGIFNAPTFVEEIRIRNWNVRLRLPYDYIIYSQTFFIYSTRQRSITDLCNLIYP